MLEIIGKQSSMIHRHKYFIIKNIPLIPSHNYNVISQSDRLISSFGDMGRGVG